uniref:Wall-associated receptor kinase galacturonan-binding domain-containing protein n=1 Tax=Hordeum vulgare subsp. vulgare TaxID=112509 RepID=A0A8I6WW69_HORVV
MSPSCCWLLVFAGVWWLPPMLVVAEDQQGGDCSTMKCGNFSIIHPFSLTDRQTGRPCGPDPYPDFDVACINSSIPTLRSSIPLNNGFAILNISYEKHSLYAIDLGKLDVLNAPNKCRAVFYNTSVKLNVPFKIAPANLHIILYNCTEKDGAAARARRNTELVETRVRCGNEWAVLVRAGVPHDATGNYADYVLEGCDAVVVPVLDSSAGANASEYGQLMRNGFLLTWELPPLLPAPAPAPAPERLNEPPSPTRKFSSPCQIIFLSTSS